MTDHTTATPIYRNPARSPQERARDLLSHMTLEEKVAQLTSVWVYEVLDDLAFSPQKAAAKLGDGIGQITRVAGASNAAPRQTAELANTIQRYLVEQTRLGIPALIHEECCSGFMGRGATCFPQIIGVASTWEPELVAQMAAVIRTQMRAVGAHQGLSPVLDIARDPRWGRLEETFGEDPYLTARMGVAYVQALQTDDLRQGIVATGKHFLGYSFTLGGLNWAPAFIPPRELWEVFMFPFEAAIQEAGLASMMNAYHELDGIPCGASRELLTEILRNQLGFDGLVVSDYMAINQLVDYHHYARDKTHAAHLALQAGIDVELPSRDCYSDALVEGVRTGAVDPALVDQSVIRVLEMKFALGLFEHPYVDEEAAPQVFETPEQRQLARTIAQKSIILLKNEGDLLPLDRQPGTIAVIGPNGDSIRNMLGDYSYPAHIELLAHLQERGGMDTPIPESLTLEDIYPAMKSVLQAIREKVGEGSEVLYAPGCGVNDSDTSGFDEAVAVARRADVAIVVVGDKSGLTPDCTCGEFRDRATLHLPGVQEELVRAVVETGTPTVVVFINGRPVSSPWIAAHVPAIVEAWFPGEEGGPAVADVLFGDVNPGGKLPVTVARSVGQVPIFYAHRPSGSHSFLYGDYVDETVAPLFPFGHGLSYTRFEYSDLEITPEPVSTDGTLQVRFTLANVGERLGDEVVQLYIRLRGASVTRPVKELKGFRRVTLEPGRRVAVTFDLPIPALSYLDPAMERVVEPGELEVMVGSSSADIRLTGRVQMVGEKICLGRKRPFFSTARVSSLDA
ncbi:glycoside hydrolase family 3 C-terminal domain-containing protein [Litorilinea aerophila]|uniref:Beta-glucosidase n=1 Tax=Litorilinea aerophila TaxID=1204385 RepID=A0A540VGT7_9CHLR|nr:glycoside hydrolase family 3 N-terminal domain-containing protein [Litorilinea aerophila]MCC9076864.1 glycoside hydrolase family 3 C-terminal domain-containing protein [Litorilinea aerophila]